ncbi:hypothetical protein AVEN_200156-1 [Araneus ventricosus]|uniref:Uncharacterized protein n=1 Tax=Araneus ventricosus TaxID=182803 RepID=A0A4Y2SI42_ARAVE|nr:hypothetical protein AVEN_239536-1 [Araneus ventricosus]GBN87787.1 hypothetical protein AVEN_200156-1 [Araneus ventricosus]
MSREAILQWCQQFEDGFNRCRKTQPLMLIVESYCETLRGLRKAVENKRRGKNTGFASQFWMGGLAASPDLAPCDFHVFGKLKVHLGGRQFSNNDQVQTVILSWLQDQGEIFYRQGIERLVQRSDKCLQRLGHYVEK